MLLGLCASAKILIYSMFVVQSTHTFLHQNTAVPALPVSVFVGTLYFSFRDKQTENVTKLGKTIQFTKTWKQLHSSSCMWPLDVTALDTSETVCWFAISVLLKWLRSMGKWLMQMDATLAFLYIFTSCHKHHLLIPTRLKKKTMLMEHRSLPCWGVRLKCHLLPSIISVLSFSPF